MEKTTTIVMARDPPVGARQEGPKCQRQVAGLSSHRRGVRVQRKATQRSRSHCLTYAQDIFKRGGLVRVFGNEEVRHRKLPEGGAEG